MPRKHILPVHPTSHEGPVSIPALSWEPTTLGDACSRCGGDIQTGPFGSQLHASDYVAEGVPSIMPQNIGDNRVIEEGIARIKETDAKRLSRYRVRKGDIVYSRRGDVERRALIREHEDGWLCGTGCSRIRFGGSAVNAEYASYYLGHPEVRAWIVRHAHGATMPNLNTAILSAVPFVIPPLSVQIAIAEILGALDDKIELNRRMSETLEAMARALFKSWFVDFDPARAKAEGRDPGLPDHIAGLFPDSLEGSALGSVPKGWPAVTLPEVVDLNPSRPLSRGTAAPYLDMANAPVAGHSAHVVVTRPFGSGTRFMNGDTLLARITPCLENGKTALVDFLKEGQVGWGSTEFVVLRPKPPLPPEYGYCLARDPRFREFAIQSMTGSSGRQRVPVDSLKHFVVCKPSREVAATFGETVAPLFARVKTANIEVRVLANLRDTLLPKLISGEIRVGQAKAMAKAAGV